MNKAIWFEDVTVTDPVSGGEVKVSMYRHENGGIFGIDASFLTNGGSIESYATGEGVRLTSLLQCGAGCGATFPSEDARDHHETCADCPEWMPGKSK